MAKKSDKPNILVIWGDDIGISNLSCYTHGLMGYKTPNIAIGFRYAIPVNTWPIGTEASCLSS